jgi:hypothetical protein
MKENNTFFGCSSMTTIACIALEEQEATKSYSYIPPYASWKNFSGCPNRWDPKDGHNPLLHGVDVSL